MFPVCCVNDAHPGTRASRPHICPAQPWPTAPPGWNGNGALPFIRTGQCQFTRAGWLPAGNVALTLHHLQPRIRMRAGRPRSRVGLRPCQLPLTGGVILEVCKRPLAWPSLGRLRHWDGTLTGPYRSFGLAHAVHAGRVAACRQRCADAPPPPARNKDAGETPAFPGGASPLPTPPHGGGMIGRLACGALPFIWTGPCRTRRQGGCLPATSR